MRGVVLVLALVILGVGTWQWRDSPEIVPECAPDPNVVWI